MNLFIGFAVLSSLIWYYVVFETVNLECLPDQLLIYSCLIAGFFFIQR